MPRVLRFPLMTGEPWSGVFFLVILSLRSSIRSKILPIVNPFVQDHEIKEGSDEKDPFRP
jgi:hypothetical protein